MANSKYAYVRDFELPDRLLPGTFIVLRIDGHSFRLCPFSIHHPSSTPRSSQLHRFTEEHHFVKPNDHRGLELMDHAAVDLMREFPDIVFGFGQSDEFRHVLSDPNARQPRLHLPSVFSFANPRHSTTDADQKLRRLCARILQLRTL